MMPTLLLSKCRLSVKNLVLRSLINSDSSSMCLTFYGKIPWTKMFSLLRYDLHISVCSLAVSQVLIINSAGVNLWHCTQLADNISSFPLHGHYRTVRYSRGTEDKDVREDVHADLSLFLPLYTEPNSAILEIYFSIYVKPYIQQLHR